MQVHDFNVMQSLPDRFKARGRHLWQGNVATVDQPAPTGRRKASLNGYLHVRVLPGRPQHTSGSHRNLLDQLLEYGPEVLVEVFGIEPKETSDAGLGHPSDGYNNEC